jgi:hypothetical protein
LYIDSSVIASGKNHVSARFDARARAVDRCLQAFDRQRIGARDDDKFRIGLRIRGCLDAIDHLLLRYSSLLGR